MDNYYKSILKNASFAYAYHRAEFDELGRVIDYFWLEVNDIYEQITGFNSDIIVNKSIKEFYPIVEIEKVNFFEIVTEIFKSGQKKEIVIFSELLNRWIKFEFQKVEKDTFCVMFWDMNKIVDTQAKLKYSDELFKSMLESITDGVVAFDKEMNYLFLNNKAAELLGKKPEDLIGKNYYELFPEAINTPLQKFIKIALKTKLHIHSKTTLSHGNVGLKIEFILLMME